MEKQLKPGPFKKLKERTRAEQQKIKKLVIKHKDDFLTAFEKSWRDWFLKPITKIFYKSGIRANHITYLGFGLIAIAIEMYFTNYSFKWQLLFLILTGLSDGLDGPMARNNNNITVLGTWLDHIRDGFLLIWASFLIYKFRLLAPEVLIVIFSLQIILIWTIIKSFLIRYLQGLPEEEAKILIHKFSLDNLQASIIGRIEFFCWVWGYFFLLSSLIKSWPILLTLGHVFIFLQIVFAIFNIWESYQKPLSTLD